MAESNQRKFAEPIDLGDEDPFAELTRIMGFDPRIAVKGQPRENPAPANEDPAPIASPIPAAAATPTKAAPVAVVAPVASKAVEPFPAAAPEAQDDFGIDLEKELLGEFADFEAPRAVGPAAVEASVVAPEASAAVTQEPVAAAIADEFDGEFEDAFAKVLDDDIASTTTPFQPSHVDEAGGGSVADDLVAELDFGDIDLHEPSAEAAEAPAAPSLSTAEPHEPVVDLNFDDIDLDEPSLESKPVEAPAVSPVEQPEPIVDLNFDDIDLDEPSLALKPAEAPAVSPVEQPEPALDLNFDDIDFNEPGPIATETHAAPADTWAAAQPDLELDFDAIDFDEPSPQAEPFEPTAAPIEPFVSHRPEPVVASAAARDALAEVDMDFSAAFDHEIATEGPGEGIASQAMAEDQDPVDIWDTQLVQQAPALSEIKSDDPVELNIEEELNALLSAAHDRPRSAEPAIAEAPAAPQPAPAAPFSYDPRWSALETDEEDAPAQIAAPAAATIPAAWPAIDQRRPFHDPSLIARHANFQAPAPQSADDLDDLLDAMEHEVHAPDHLPAPAEPAPKSHYDFGNSAPAAHAGTDYAPDEPATDDQAVQGSELHGFTDHEEDAPPAASYVAAPEIETVEVPETAVAIAHDFDIPELAYEEDKPQAPAYDDIDADFAAAFQDNKPNEEPVNQVVRGVARPAERADFDAEFEALYSPSYQDAGQPVAYEGNVTAFQPAAAGYRYEAPQPHGYEDFEASEQPAVGRDRFVDLDFDSDPHDEAMQGLAAHTAAEQPQRRRGLLIAAVVGGVALLGGVGALALSFGGGEGTATPVVVKADDSPVKVKPENPGGATVPNQDNKVYDAVKGTAAATDAPTQEKLVTTSEEPVDMAAITDNDPLPGVNADEDIIPKAETDIVPKAEDRIDPATDADQSEAAADGVVVAPRKVKTMIVRSDGTLVAREDSAPAADAAVAEAPAAPAGNDKTGTVAAQEETASPTAGDAVPVQPVKTSKVVSEPETTPEASALPPAKPAKAAAAKTETPKSETVASVEAEPTAVATGAWSVQIASQPSAESAKSTYEDLARRYGGVIGGRGVNIVKAEIAGKGTYWRVRVPAKSRDEAVSLCNDYKAAGGNCFISK